MLAVWSNRVWPRRPVVRAAVALIAAILFRPTPAAAADDSLEPAVLKKIKQATVRLKVVQADGTVTQGSGFFAAGPGLVVTNAHVLGMLRWESPKPRKVEVVVNGGEPTEKTYVAETIGIDAGSDLGVLAVRVKGLPDPLPLAGAAKGEELVETQVVYIFGYPFGDVLGKNVTVSKSAISSIRMGASGVPVKIQVNGGINPGNSGGPVTDTKGTVIGVAVSGTTGMGISFAIPVRAVHSFLGGRAHRTVYGNPYKEGQVVKMPVTVFAVDPLKGAKSVRIETWSGDPGPDRQLDAKPREPRPGDSTRLKQELVYKDGVAQGDVTLPEVPSGKVFWIQVFLVKTNGTESFNISRVFRPSAVVDRIPAVLAFKPQAGTAAPLLLTSDAELKLRDKQGMDHSILIKSQTELVRTTDGRQKVGGTTVGRLQFTKAKQTVSIDGEEQPKPVKEQQLLGLVDRVTTTVSLNREGETTDYQPDLARVPPRDRVGVRDLIIKFAQGFDTTVVPLPGNQIAVGKTWAAKREIQFTILSSSEPAVADLTYRYLGSRTVNTRTEAVVRFDGTVRGAKGNGINIGGKIEGQAIIDIETGQVAFASARIDVDLGLMTDKGPLQAGGVYTVALRPAPKVSPAP